MGNYNNLQERCSREVLLFVLCAPNSGRGSWKFNSLADTVSLCADFSGASQAPCAVCVHHGVVEKQLTHSLACHHGLSSCLKGTEHFEFFSLSLDVLL